MKNATSVLIAGSVAGGGTVRSSVRSSLFVLSLVLAFGASAPLAFAASPALVNLGSAGDFVIFANTGISSTGSTLITGDIGVGPGVTSSAITGNFALTTPATFSTSVLVTGNVYAFDYAPSTLTKVNTASLDMGTAYTDAAGRSADATGEGAGNIGGLTLVPGVYKWTTDVTIPTNLTLDAGNNPDAVWIFQISGNLNLSSAKNVILAGGAKASNIFWVVAGATTLGTNSTFNGIILDQTNIALQTGAKLNGRALAQTAVTLDANTIYANDSTSLTATGPVFNDKDKSGAPSSEDIFYPTIQAAVDAASTGDTIIVTAGTYTENVEIFNKLDLTIQGAGQGEDGTIIAGSGTGIAIKNSNGLTIKNLKIHTSGSEMEGIWVYGAALNGNAITGLTIQNTTIDVGAASGIVIDASIDAAHSGFHITGNHITSDSVAMSIQDLTDSTISGNELTVQTAGTNVLWTSERHDLASLVFSNNIVSGSGGVQVLFVTDYNAVSSNVPQENTPVRGKITGLTIHDNTFSHWDTKAIKIGDQANTLAGTVTGISITGNTFNDNHSVSTTVFAPMATTIIGGLDAPNATGSGNTFNVSGTAKIQTSIGAAFAGDTIHVTMGTYDEAIHITKPLTIAGAGPNQTTLSSNSLYMVSVEANDVTIKDLAITSPLYNGTGDASGIVDSANGRYSNLHITNVKIHDIGKPGRVDSDGTQGINVGPIDGLQIDHSEIYNINSVGSNNSVAFAITMWGRTGNLVNNVNIHDNVIHDITSSATVQSIAVPFFASNINIHDNVIHDVTGSVRADGIALANSANVTVNHNTITGPFTEAGIYTATNMVGPVTITNNTVTGASLYGILLRSPLAQTVTGNTISGATVGIQVNDTVNVAPIINSNSISGNTTGLNNLSSNIVDATKNWWGSADPVFATIISGSVNHAPWYTNAAMTTLSNGNATNASYSSTVDGQADLPTDQNTIPLTNGTVLDIASSVNTVSGENIIVGGTSLALNNEIVLGVDLTQTQTIGGQDVLIKKAVQLSSSNSQPIVLSNTELPSVSVSIPNDTTILAPSEWNGTIAPPKAIDPSGDTPGFSVGGAVEFGSHNVVLLFNNPVTIFLPGITGTVVYNSANSSSWNTITACTGSYESPESPTFPGECSIVNPNGSGTKILTYHFTTFGEMIPDPTPAPTPTPSHGGGNACGLGFVFNPATVGCDRIGANQGQVLGASTGPIITPQGQVLGVATFNFTRDLGVGLSGADVTALQQILIDAGILKINAPTGNFGQLTKAAVQAFQKAHGVSQTGFVGPLTRGELNKGVTPTAESAGKTNLTASQADAIISIIESFGADASVVAKVRASLGR